LDPGTYASKPVTQTVFNIRTAGPGLHEFTDEVVRFVRDSGLREGLLTLFVQHTSCSLLVQENADPDVRRDLDEFFRRLVPSSDDPSMQWLRHTAEGSDDMPAHIKAALTAVSRRASEAVRNREPDIDLQIERLLWCGCIAHSTGCCC